MCSWVLKKSILTIFTYYLEYLITTNVIIVIFSSSLLPHFVFCLSHLCFGHFTLHYFLLLDLKIFLLLSFPFVNQIHIFCYFYDYPRGYNMHPGLTVNLKLGFSPLTEECGDLGTLYIYSVVIYMNTIYIYNKVFIYITLLLYIILYISPNLLSLCYCCGIF